MDNKNCIYYLALKAATYFDNPKENPEYEEHARNLLDLLKKGQDKRLEGIEGYTDKIQIYESILLNTKTLALKEVTPTIEFCLLIYSQTAPDFEPQIHDLPNEDAAQPHYNPYIRSRL